jgi:predicted amidophosphoribosyltransferase
MDVIAELGRGLGELASRALDLALPASCAGCEREGSALCPDCAAALDVRLELPAGVPIGLPGDVPEPLAQVEWCASFSGVARRAVHKLKYAGDRRLAEPLGAAVGRRWLRAGAGGEVLVPVPASPDRVADRGYDQAELIARAAGRACGLPVRLLLERTRATTAQFDLDRQARAGNVAGAFRLRPDAFGAGIQRDAGPGNGHAAAADGTEAGGLERADGGVGPGGADGTDGPDRTGAPGGFRGAWIVLVDDVMTTGSTLAACARVLLDHGAGAVSAITVARER